MAGDFDSYPGDFEPEETPKPPQPETEFAPDAVAGGGYPIPLGEIAALSRVSADAERGEYVKGRKGLETLGDPEE